MQDHTPGPWEAFDAKNQDGDVTISIRGDSEFIATMDVTSIDGGPFTLPPRGVANARLIAAAPELLEACKRALDCMNIMRGLIDFQSAAAIEEATAQKLIEAIAKVEKSKQ